MHTTSNHVSAAGERKLHDPQPSVSSFNTTVDTSTLRPEGRVMVRGGLYGVCSSWFRGGGFEVRLMFHPVLGYLRFSLPHHRAEPFTAVWVQGYPIEHQVGRPSRSAIQGYVRYVNTCEEFWQIAR